MRAKMCKWEKSRQRFVKQPDATSSGLTRMWDVGSNVGAKLVTIERNSEQIISNARTRYLPDDQQRDSIVTRTQAEETTVEKAISTLFADDACHSTGRSFLATRSRNARVSRTSFSLTCQEAH